MVDSLLASGGEGVVIRQPRSAYTHGRSDSLIKLKAYRDQEGLLIGINNGSLTLQLPSGNTFEVQQGDEFPNLNIGDILTVSCHHFAQDGTPVVAKVLKVRTDVTWEDLLGEGTGKTRQANATTYKSLVPLQAHARGYWTIDENKNIRKFFDDFAKLQNFDPLTPQNWYRYTSDDILRVKHGGSALGHYIGSIIRALVDVYPNIGLDATKFDNMPKRYWASPENRRNFFERFSKSHNFDPLVPDNWYSFTKTHIIAEKGGGSLLNHTGSVAKAVVEAFPDIGLDVKKFFGKSYWHSASNRRKYFDDIAKRRNFDPLLADNWHSFCIWEEKGIETVLSVYQGSYTRAIMQLYPDIGLDEAKFVSKSRKAFWSTARNRRDFLDTFAKTKLFDPLTSAAWQNVTKSDLSSVPGGKYLLYFYGQSLERAITELYPEFGLPKG